MHSLFDLYPDLTKKDKNEAIEKLQEILQWIENQPISKLPYVEMGFDALDVDLISSLQDHKEDVLSNYSNINLQTKPIEYVDVVDVYQEQFPYWFCPYVQKPRVTEFRAGNRVMNLNSTMRSFIPFGLRGTVVGKTEQKVIVLFDDQFLGGNSVNGHC